MLIYCYTSLQHDIRCSSIMLSSSFLDFFCREIMRNDKLLNLLIHSIEALGASRCFNCGSYSHSLRDCPKPRDNIAISNARKMHTSKRNPTAGNHAQVRYYQKAPGKFDDLQAGVLGAETRECLGIGVISCTWSTSSFLSEFSRSYNKFLEP